MSGDAGPAVAGSSGSGTLNLNLNLNIGVGFGSTKTVESNGFETFRKQGLEVADYTGPYSQLWNLLVGNTRVVSPDIILDQLKSRCNKIISMLTLYKFDGDASASGEGALDIKHVIKGHIMEKLNVSDKVAVELLCTYIVFEYNGVVTGLKTLLSTKSSQAEFLNRIEAFYKRERLCLIYCSQVILANAADESHVYHEVFGGFIASASMENWTKWMCISLQCTICEEETIEILHALTLMIYHYGGSPHILLTLMKHFKHFNADDMTYEIRQAEAVFFTTLLQCGTEEDDKTISDFVMDFFDVIKANDMLIFPMLTYFQKRYKGVETVRKSFSKSVSQRISTPEFTALVKSYSSDGFKYRHGVGPVALKCLFNILDVILDKYHIESIGTKQQFLDLLNCFLKNKEIAYTFLCERPDHITNLYDEALFLFPVHLEPLLSIWASFAQTCNDRMTALEILESAAQIICLAEYFSNENHRDLLVTGKNVISNVDRTVAGVIIPSGTKGQTIIDADRHLIIWSLDDSCTLTDVWDVVIRTYFFMPAYKNTELSDDEEKAVLSMADFLIRFAECSSEISNAVLRVFPIVCYLLRRMVHEDSDMSKRSGHVALLLRTISSGSKFAIKFLQEQTPGLWPIAAEDSFVRDIVLSYEILSSTDFAVIKAFLKSLLDLLLSVEEEVNRTLGGNGGGNIVRPEYPWRTELIKDAVIFLFQVISPTCWRSAPLIDRNEIILGCLRVFHALFNLPDSWNVLKARVCSELIHPKSILLVLLRTDEEKLRDCRIRPSEENLCLENMMHLGLSLLLRLVHFDVPRIYQFLDASSGSNLIQCLAKLFSHRVITTLPCLAIKLLSKLAEDLNISILSCIGHEMSAFCDLIILRLSYKSEDTDLRVATLEFLAVCVQTQPGVMNRFLEADSLPTCIYSLLEEEESALPPATLTLVRVLVGKGNSILKHGVPNIWKLITNPIYTLEKFERAEQQTILTCTMHILSFELYREGISDEELCDEVSKIIGAPVMKKLIKIAIKDQDPACKCLLAIKHLMTLIMSKPELASLLETSTCKELCIFVTDEFWRNKRNVLGKRNELSAPLAELMLLFANEQTHHYLQTLASHLLVEFFTENLAVQIPLLACLNKVVASLNDEELSTATAENLGKIISKIFTNAIKLYEAVDGKKAQPLLSLAASTAFNIAQSKKASAWLPIFHREMLVAAIVYVANIGLEKGIGPEVVLECLSTLIKLCQRPETSTSLRNCGVSANIWVPALKFCSPETSGKWLDVYILCCELNSVLVLTQKHYYLTEALNFWACHAPFLSFKLFDLATIVDQCFMNSPERNFTQLVEALKFNYFTMNSISVMIPYITKWRLEQQKNLSDLMQGILVALKTSVSLLTHPNHLLLVITKNSKTSNVPMSFRLTPQLMEVQNRLWDIMLLGVHIFLKLRKHNFKLLECQSVVPLLFSIISLPVKVLGKIGDKKTQPIINSSRKVTMTLEKSLALLASRVRFRFEDPTQNALQRQTFRRETMSEAGSICDSVRRLGLPSGDYSIKLCSTIEFLYRP